MPLTSKGLMGERTGILAATEYTPLGPGPPLPVKIRVCVTLKGQYGPPPNGKGCPMLNSACSATRLALAIVVSLGLSACASTTVNVTVVEQQGSVTGTGSLDASRNSGTMRVSFSTKTYEGHWTAVRTSGADRTTHRASVWRI